MKLTETRNSNNITQSHNGIVRPTKVSIVYIATDAEEVYIAGDFNRWDPRSTPLIRDAYGVWRTVLQLPPGPHEYRFVVDGKWLNDPRAPLSATNPFGTSNSVLQVS